MKKFLFAASAAILLTLISCNDSARVAGESKDNSQAEKNLKADAMVSKAFTTGDMSGIDSAVADDFVDHTDRGDKVGRDSLKAMIAYVRSNFKDMKMETVKEIADDEYVFSWLRITGTSDGTVPGMPAGPYDMRPIQVTKFKDGKAVEHWEFMEVREMMKWMAPPAKQTNITTDTVRRK